MSEDKKDCGEEGHVCVCGATESANSDSPKSFTVPLEDWILRELEMTVERLGIIGDDENRSVVFGVLVAISQCVLHVKITAKHDEIAAAYKKSVLDLKRAGGDKGEGLVSAESLMYHGLGIFQKLELEKAQMPITDDRWNRYWADLLFEESRIAAEMKRRWE